MRQSHIPLRTSLFVLMLCVSTSLNAQLRWTNADDTYAPLPKGFHVFKTSDSLDGKPFCAFYAIADLENKRLEFTTDTTYKRRFTPSQFYTKNNQPLLVVNSTFFSFATHQNLNMVMKDGKITSHNLHSIPLKGKDTLMYKHPFAAAIGITKKRSADVAWTYTDPTLNNSYALQSPRNAMKDSSGSLPYKTAYIHSDNPRKDRFELSVWPVQTAVGGGPVLVQRGDIKITNNEELKFSGKAIHDKHPRTLMGYTKKNKLIIMVIQGRSPGISEGASLEQAAKLMAGLGCVEALNLDGGGSSCMLINGKETIWPSDKGQQRAVPAVFIIKSKSR